MAYTTHIKTLYFTTTEDSALYPTIFKYIHKFKYR